MISTNIINLVKSASALLGNQKNIAFFKEEGYEDPNGFLSRLGIDSNLILGGAFGGSVKEVLSGGKTGIDIATLDDAVSFIFKNSPASANGISDSRIFEHPLEYNTEGVSSKDGRARNYIADHSILLPETFNCVMYLPPVLFTSVIDEVDALNADKTLLRIITKGKVYRNMVLVRYEKPITPDKLYRMPITLHFREIQLRYPKSEVPKNASDSSGGMGVGQ